MQSFSTPSAEKGPCKSPNPQAEMRRVRKSPRNSNQIPEYELATRREREITALLEENVTETKGKRKFGSTRGAQLTGAKP